MNAAKIVLDDEGLVELYRVAMVDREDADREGDAVAAEAITKIIMGASELYYHDFGKHISKHGQVST